MMLFFAVLLTVLFVGLKLTAHIDWSWVWVVSPLWIWFSVWITVVISLVVFSVKTYTR